MIGHNDILINARNGTRIFFDDLTDIGKIDMRADVVIGPYGVRLRADVVIGPYDAT